ncbi:MAG: 50S ribosomal protein L25/general stress protein Ctc [Phycisphaerales bacterium]|nr:50S ribosomal protein L25/general stress protein Ctc [Phycisphaerales bacterium]
MSTTFELKADLRGQLGKGASRRLRRAGKVPAILYGGGQDPVPLLLDQLELINQFKNEAIFSHILTLQLDNRTEQVVLRDVQRHPFKPVFLHLDFLRVRADRQLRTLVPLHFINEAIAPGIKQQGGIASHVLTEVEIECLPQDLPEFIEVDLSHLEMGHAIHLSEVKLPAGVVLANPVTADSETDMIVVSIHHPQGGGEDEEATESEPANP